jgi:VCBS repeat-containing protein
MYGETVQLQLDAEGTFIYAMFANKQEVLNLSKGQEIVVVCQISRIYSFGIGLDDCHLAK